MSDLVLENYQRDGITGVTEPLTVSQIDLLKAEYQKTLDSKQKLHYNQLAGLHNPWGKSAHLFDSWALLDICQSDSVLQLVSSLIGPDIILWESAFFGYNALKPFGSWTRHSEFSPIDPMQGVTVRIVLDPKDSALDYIPGSHHIEPSDVGLEHTKSEKHGAYKKLSNLKTGSVFCHDIRLIHRYSQTGVGLCRGEYVIHHMPATSLFERAPDSALQQRLSERLPLINYGKSPIWLVKGEDHSGNNFVTGFSPPVGQWTNAQW